MSHPPRLRILTVGKASVTCDAGTWIALPQEITTHEFSPNAHILSIHFLCQWPSGENLLTIRSPIIAKSRNHPGMERDASRLVRKQFPEYEQQDLAYGNQPSAYGNFLRLQGLFFNWLAAWFSLCTANGARVTRLSSGDHRPFLAARCLNQASLDRPFPAEQIQREAGLGLMRLNQLFFAEFSLTTRKYWDRRRLDFAKQCLETSLMPMKEISYRLNFRSDSHFVVWFRRQTGSRPRDYRRIDLKNVGGRRTLD